MKYKRYSDEELLEIYTTMLEYSGETDDILNMEIKERGGIEQIQESINKKMILPNEIKRINELVFTTYKNNQDTAFIGSTISSNILTQEELSTAINHAIQKARLHTADKSVGAGTIIRALLGIVTASPLGAGLWYYSIFYTGSMYYMLIPFILIPIYITIRLFTRKTTNNVIVFSANFIAAFIAVILGTWWYYKMTN